MAEEAGAPEHARGRLHGVQREPHDPAAEQGHGRLPPASGSVRCPGRPGRDWIANKIFVEGVDTEGWADRSSGGGCRS